MTSEDGLKLLLSKLDECGIPYMITGSQEGKKMNRKEKWIEIPLGAIKDKRLNETARLTIYTVKGVKLTLVPLGDLIKIE